MLKQITLGAIVALVISGCGMGTTLASPLYGVGWVGHTVSNVFEGAADIIEDTIDGD